MIQWNVDDTGSVWEASFGTLEMGGVTLLARVTKHRNANDKIVCQAWFCRPDAEDCGLFYFEAASITDGKDRIVNMLRVIVSDLHAAVNEDAPKGGWWGGDPECDHDLNAIGPTWTTCGRCGALWNQRLIPERHVAVVEKTRRELRLGLPPEWQQKVMPDGRCEIQGRHCGDPRCALFHGAQKDAG